MIKRKTNGSSCVIVKLIHKPHRKDNAFAMNTVTQTMKFRQSLLSYAEKHEVTQAAINAASIRRKIIKSQKSGVSERESPVSTINEKLAK